MKKEKMKIAFYGVMSMLLIILIMCSFKIFYTSPKKFNYETYIVQKGDTLWSIAASTHSKVDIREIVYMIRQKNDINPMIYPGQKIFIPVFKN